MNLRAIAVLVPILAALAACERTSGSVTASVVRDSAGIQVVESHAPAWGRGDGWKLSTQPSLVIGEMEGLPAYQFNGVRDVRRLSTGAVAVANGGSGEVRIFAPDGSHLRTIGRQGGGPGEFRNLEWIQVSSDDTLAVYDGRERRLTLFAPDGSLARMVSVHPDPSLGMVRPLGILADGTLLVVATQTADRPPGQGLVRLPVVVSRLSTDGVLLDEITVLAGDERMIRIETSGGEITSISIQSRPFYRRSEVRAAGERVFAADTDRDEIRVFAADGRLERIVRRPREPATVSDAEFAAYRESLLERAETADQRRSLEADLSGIVFPDTRPAFTSLRIDGSGRVWVQEFQIIDDVVSVWSVFDRDGRWLGDVEIPARFRPTEIGDDYVLGVWRDPLDVEYVHAYSISAR